MRDRTTKLIYQDHRFAPWLAEVPKSLPRDCSSRLLGANTSRTVRKTTDSKQRERQQNYGFHNIHSFVRIFR